MDRQTSDGQTDRQTEGHMLGSTNGWQTECMSMVLYA